jgi:hypothetical protein
MSYERMLGMGTNGQETPPLPPGYTQRSQEEIEEIRAEAAERQKIVDEVRQFFYGIIPNRKFADISTCSVGVAFLPNFNNINLLNILPAATAISAGLLYRNKSKKEIAIAAGVGYLLGGIVPCAVMRFVMEGFRT